MQTNTIYGWPEKVQEDTATLRLIISSQGSRLLTDVIAEICGETANKFKMTDDERARVITKVVDELYTALQERMQS